MEVRWIASHYKGSIIVFDNYKNLHSHLEFIAKDRASEFTDKATKQKASKLAKTLTYRQVFWMFSILLAVEYLSQCWCE